MKTTFISKTFVEFRPPRVDPPRIKGWQEELRRQSAGYER